jgi:hypothetical protein
MKKFLTLTALMCITAVLSFSCITTPISMTQSSTYIGDRIVAQNLGKTQGYHMVWSLFGLFMFGRPDIDMAIASALQKKGGDTIINVKCYEETDWFFFFSLNKVIVEGEAVTLQPLKQK